MMGYEEKRVRTLLREHKAVLDRQNKHEVWKLPSGLTIVLPCTPSDYRAWKNSLSFLYTALDLNEAGRGSPGERREKRVRMERPLEEATLEAPPLASMSSQMRGLHPGNLRVIGAVPRKTIKHPVRRAVAPVKDISVDISGLLNKFGRG